MIKSKLSVKVFLLTALLMAVSCFLIYSFLSWSVPNFYKHDMKDAEMWIEYLPEIMAEMGKEEAPFFFEELEKELQGFFENEFELHLFRSDGREVDLGDFNQLLDREISDFDISKSGEYTIQLPSYFGCRCDRDYRLDPYRYLHTSRLTVTIPGD